MHRPPPTAARGCHFAAAGQIVKPARLHFAARALTTNGHETVLHLSSCQTSKTRVRARLDIRNASRSSAQAKCSLAGLTTYPGAYACEGLCRSGQNKDATCESEATCPNTPTSSRAPYWFDMDNESGNLWRPRAKGSSL